MNETAVAAGYIIVYHDARGKYGADNVMMTESGKFSNL